MTKKSWEEQRVEIVEHVLQMKERIEKVTPIVRVNLEKDQSRQAEHCNKTAKTHYFNLMVLVPTPESKLFTHWQGPYEVIEEVWPCDR